MTRQAVQSLLSGSFSDQDIFMKSLIPVAEKYYNKIWCALTTDIEKAESVECDMAHKTGIIAKRSA